MRWTVITNCDSFFISKCDTVYHKLRQVLQSAMDLLQIITGITKCDDYYTLRQYNLPFCSPKNQVTPPPSPKAINNDRSLRVVNYICIIYLFVLAQWAPFSLSKRKVPQVPNEKQFKGIKCKRDLSVENNKQTKKKKHQLKRLLRNFA